MIGIMCGEYLYNGPTSGSTVRLQLSGEEICGVSLMLIPTSANCRVVMKDHHDPHYPTSLPLVSSSNRDPRALVSVSPALLNIDGNHELKQLIPYPHNSMENTLFLHLSSRALIVHTYPGAKTATARTVVCLAHGTVAVLKVLLHNWLANSRLLLALGRWHPDPHRRCGGDTATHNIKSHWPPTSSHLEVGWYQVLKGVCR